MDVSTAFRALVRAIVGLPSTPGEPPDLLHSVFYRARVDNCAGDGSTLDVTPEDKRISPEKGVRVRVGIPGAVVTVRPGAIVLLGWERGDTSRPYCVPSWEDGAKLLSLSIGDGADAVATKTDLTNLISAIESMASTGNGGGPLTFTAPTELGSTSVSVQR